MAGVGLELHRVAEDAAESAAEVLCDAFDDYPLMRHVIDPGTAYAAHLRTLVGFFVRARFWRKEPVFAISEGSDLVAAALVSFPTAGPVPEAMTECREAVWAALGRRARERYEAFGRLGAAFDFPEPHVHLNMIGVRRAHAGRGLGRRLVDEVHELARHHPGALGVSLTTEKPANVAVYRHLGYRIVGTADVTPSLRTWGFFRPNQMR